MSNFRYDVDGMLRETHSMQEEAERELAESMDALHEQLLANKVKHSEKAPEKKQSDAVGSKQARASLSETGSKKEEPVKQAETASTPKSEAMQEQEPAVNTEPTDQQSVPKNSKQSQGVVEQDAAKADPTKPKSPQKKPSGRKTTKSVRVQKDEKRSVRKKTGYTPTEAKVIEDMSDMNSMSESLVIHELSLGTASRYLKNIIYVDKETTLMIEQELRRYNNALESIRVQLKGIGINLNQAVKVENTKQKIGTQDVVPDYYLSDMITVAKLYSSLLSETEHILYIRDTTKM